jgi:CubicO group peptidase (beta-lactamase class C family)
MKGVGTLAHVIGLLAAVGMWDPLCAGDKALTDSAIQRAAEFSAKEKGRSLLVMEHGKIRFEQYVNGAAPKPYKIYSGTKAFWNLAALAAAQDHLLRLDDKVSDTVAAWRDDPLKSRITIRQLLDFTAGLDPVFDIHEDGLKDRDAMAVRAPVVAEPGTRFIYGPASLQMLHVILEQKLAARHETPTHYLESHVLAPLNLGPQRYVADKAGNPLLAAGFLMSAKMWTNLGHAMLERGHPVVSHGYFENCREGTDANPAFALGVWNNRLAHRGDAREVDVEKMLHEKWPKQDWSRACLCRDAPEDLLACIGSGGQRLYVVPSRDLIIVRQGNTSDLYDAAFLRLLFAKVPG